MMEPKSPSAAVVDSANTGAHGTLAPELTARPSVVDETGLSRELLLELLLKHLYTKGVQTQGDLSTGLALSGGIVADLVAQLKRQAMIEVYTSVDNNGLLAPVLGIV